MGDIGGMRNFEAPGPGTWSRDPAHNPVPMTRLAIELYRHGFASGFLEAFETFGVPVASMQLQTVRGYVYNCMTPLGAGPGAPEGEELFAEFGRRAERAQEVLDTRAWRAVLDRWNREVKPRAIDTHLRLAAVDLSSLSDAALADHVAACFEHSRAMAHQHHQFNTSALVPLGDFCVQAAPWTGEPVAGLLALFEGCSPISGVWSDEIAPAARAVAADAASLALVRAEDGGAGGAGERLAALRERLPEVDRWTLLAGCRLIDGFDLTAPTLQECPALLLGKLAAAVEQGGPRPTANGEAAAARVRSKVPEQHRAAFDELYREARDTYWFRDERGVYSDIASSGLTRLAVLELGRRLAARGTVDIPEHLFDAGPEEVLDLAGGASTPDGAELRARAKSRAEAATLEPPDVLGDPPSPPPPLETMPPALARMVTAVRFAAASLSGSAVERSTVEGTVRGLAGSPGIYAGRARVIKEFAELMTLEPGDVLVAATTTEACNSAIHLVGAIVTDHGGAASHPAIVAREMGIPAVVNTKVGTKEIPDGATVTVDGTAGTVTVRS